MPCYIGVMGAYPDPSGAAGSFFSSNYGGYYTGNGMLIPNENTSLTTCTDGTSNTIIVAEQSGTVGTADLRNRYYSPWGGATFTTRVSQGNPGDSWSMGITAAVYRINSTGPAAGSDNTYDADTIMNSKHTGGINVVYSDGSVKFLSDTIDFLEFQKLCVRNDGLVNNN